MSYCYNSVAADVYAHQQGMEADYYEACEKWSQEWFEDMDYLDSFMDGKHYDILWKELGEKSAWIEEDQFWETMEKSSDFKKQVFDTIRRNAKLCQEYDEFLMSKFDKHLSDVQDDWD